MNNSVKNNKNITNNIILLFSYISSLNACSCPLVCWLAGPSVIIFHQGSRVEDTLPRTSEDLFTCCSEILSLVQGAGGRCTQPCTCPSSGYGLKKQINMLIDIQFVL